MLPKTKPSKQMIFDNGTSQGQGSKRDGDGAVTMAVFSNATRLHGVGEGSSSVISSPPETEDKMSGAKKVVSSYV